MRVTCVIRARIRACTDLAGLPFSCPPPAPTVSATA